MLKSRHLQLGKQAEMAACRYLQARGLSLIKQNYRCFHGEIDLIMQENHDIVFVEVRYRNRLDYGHPFDTINQVKTRKIIKAASHYLQKTQKLYTLNSRFDVVGVQTISGELKIDWLVNAFNAAW